MDANGVVRLLNTNVAGDLIWNTQEMATTAAMNGLLGAYTNTAALNTLLGTYATMVALNNAISTKANSSQVLTDVPINALFTDTLYVHPSQHQIATITGLQTA